MHTKLTIARRAGALDVILAGREAARRAGWTAEKLAGFVVRARGGSSATARRVAAQYFVLRYT